jgi:hypothetical protein
MTAARAVGEQDKPRITHRRVSALQWGLIPIVAHVDGGSMLKQHRNQSLVAVAGGQMKRGVTTIVPLIDPELVWIVPHQSLRKPSRRDGLSRIGTSRPAQLMSGACLGTPFVAVARTNVQRRVAVVVYLASRSEGAPQNVGRTVGGGS